MWDKAQKNRKSIFDYVNSSSSKVNKPSQAIHTQFTLSNADVASSNMVIPNSPVVYPRFTHDEISILTEMIHEWKQKKVAEQSEEIQEPKKVHERIKALPQVDKTRKERSGCLVFLLVHKQASGIGRIGYYQV